MVEYTTTGEFVRAWTVSGRADGMRAAPDGLLYVLFDPDANPRLFTIASNQCDASLQPISIQQNLTHGGNTA